MLNVESNVERSTISRHVSSPHQQYRIACHRFSKLIVTIIYTFQSSEGYRYCLTIIDWPTVTHVSQKQKPYQKVNLQSDNKDSKDLPYFECQPYYLPDGR
ncbi:hypothetical protein CEXT_455571 [Caerostris extrusa]|uniref:Uncharacterized protein n=1 Tax=Caerostris extrusa TaxID=172846 RepID=A0AAV4QQZ5_CAEEX|nr:hypothetical protein CEXT_455571 [Caerostris extrusa]